MKPGQVVDISPSAHADLPPVKGLVAEVSQDAIVIDLDPARRGTFAPHTPIALSYDGEDGRHELATRVIGMQGPSKLILLPSAERPKPQRPATDPRARIRVEHLLRMDYEVVPPEELDRMREEVLNGPCILKYERPGVVREAPQVAGAEGEILPDELVDTPLGALLIGLHRKVDAILERLDIEVPGDDERPMFNVSLSSRGLRFRDFERRCRAGDLVAITIELPLLPTIEVRAIGETLYVVEDVRHPNLSTGQDVVLEFRVIRDDTREQIERYCIANQGARRSA
jgi:hypothetical protein